MYTYDERFQRSVLLIGRENQERLRNAHVAVFGLGGVGSHAAEALARAGIGTLSLIDKDVVDVSNTNRQLPALDNTIGRLKTDVVAERLRLINPEIELHLYSLFIKDPGDCEALDPAPDYLIDAIDTVTGKLLLAEYSRNRGIPMIMCLGTGNKLDPSRFTIDDIYRTSVCPLAKVMRKELKARGFEQMTVLYSTEPPLQHSRPAGTLSYVPPVAGYMLAGHIIRSIIQLPKEG